MKNDKLITETYQPYLPALAEKAVKKWEQTGLLKGLEGYKKLTVAKLLENQASEIARARMVTEASDNMDIKGFQNIAFPIVRRVFGGLLANDIVSVQPMSLPAGLLFYLDFTYGTTKAGGKSADFSTGGSVYGNQTSPSEFGYNENLGTGGHYNYGTSYSQREVVSAGPISFTTGSVSEADVDYDPDLTDSLSSLRKITVESLYSMAIAGTGGFANYGGDLSALKHWVLLSTGSTATTTGVPGTPVQFDNVEFMRRHTKRSGNNVVFIAYCANWSSFTETAAGLSYVMKTGFTADGTGTLLLPPFESDFADPSQVELPEIDIKVNSVGVVAEYRKLKIKWSPELAQNMAAYLNLDPEVELTQILSEQIAIDIDREIVADILDNASAGNFFWSRLPGNFVHKLTGTTIAGYDKYVARTQKEWYETLVETIIDASNTIYRKTLRGSGNFIVASPDVCTMLEATLNWHASSDPTEAKETSYQIGAEKMGVLANKFIVYKDPYMPRNKILVGYKGNSFLETGYVYAPYVPLVVTPTIFHPEDFTPRKGAMTAYAKRMIRSDFYATITCKDMNIF